VVKDATSDEEEKEGKEEDSEVARLKRILQERDDEIAFLKMSDDKMAKLAVRTTARKRAPSSVPKVVKKQKDADDGKLFDIMMSKHRTSNIGLFFNT